jgi:hypothetical protein
MKEHLHHLILVAQHAAQHVIVYLMQQQAHAFLEDNALEQIVLLDGILVLTVQAIMRMVVKQIYIMMLVIVVHAGIFVELLMLLQDHVIAELVQ